jgi:hypothetical protein
MIHPFGNLHHLSDVMQKTAAYISSLVYAAFVPESWHTDPTDVEQVRHIVSTILTVALGFLFFSDKSGILRHAESHRPAAFHSLPITSSDNFRICSPFRLS